MVKNIFREKFETLGVSYAKFANDTPYSTPTWYSWINNPARCGHCAIMKVGTALGFDEKEIVEFWKSLKMEQAVKRLEKW